MDVIGRIASEPIFFQEGLLAIGLGRHPLYLFLNPK